MAQLPIWPATGKTILDARDWIGYAASSADVHTTLQAALNSARDAGPGHELQLPPGPLYVSAPIEPDSFVALRGHLGSSIIRVGGGSNCGALKSARYNAGGETGGTEKASIIGVEFDQNIGENAGVAEPLVSYDGIRPIIDLCNFKGGRINLKTIQSRPNLGSGDRLEDGLIQRLGFLDGIEANFLAEGPHDSLFRQLLARSNTGVNYICKAAAGVWDTCHGYGNADHAFNAYGGEFNNCIGEGAKLGQVLILMSSFSWRGGRLFDGGGEDGKIGFVFGSAEENCAGAQIIGTRLENLINGALKFVTPNTANGSIVAQASAASGNAVVGTPNTSFDLTGLSVTGGQTDNSKVRTIASSGSVPAPQTAIAEYTGVAEINTLQFGKAGQRLTVYLPGAAKLVATGNIKDALNGPASQQYVFDGTNWRKA